MEWQDLYKQWQSLMNGADLLLNPLFTVLWVCDPLKPKGCRTRFDWWEPKRMAEYYRYLNRGQTGSVDLRQKQNWRKGELSTLDYLWDAGDNLEQIAAVLIAATIFPYVHSSRTRYPSTPALGTISGIIYSAQEVSTPHWAQGCTSVLPGPYWDEPGPWVNRDDSFERADSVEVTLEKITREHWHILHYHRPVAIRTRIFDEESRQWVCNEQVDEIAAQAELQRMKEVLSRMRT